MRNGETWTEQAKLTASDAAAIHYFGLSVAISGDYAIVGDHTYDGAGFNSGSAYIFVHNGETWIEQVKLAASDIAAGDKFGYSISINGDYAIVGAPGKAHHKNAPSNSGAAYIYGLTKIPHTHACDVNGDGVVDISDMVLVGSNFGETSEGVTADINKDGLVDILDLLWVGSYFMETMSKESP